MAQFMHQRGIFCMIHSAASKTFCKFFCANLVEIPMFFSQLLLQKCDWSAEKVQNWTPNVQPELVGLRISVGNFWGHRQALIEYFSKRNFFRAIFLLHAAIRSKGVDYFLRNYRILVSFKEFLVSVTEIRIDDLDPL